MSIYGQEEESRKEVGLCWPEGVIFHVVGAKHLLIQLVIHVWRRENFRSCHYCHDTFCVFCAGNGLRLCAPSPPLNVD